jgi:hypothetical protein
MSDRTSEFKSALEEQRRQRRIAASINSTAEESDALLKSRDKKQASVFATTCAQLVRSLTCDWNRA